MQARPRLGLQASCQSAPEPGLSGFPASVLLLANLNGMGPLGVGLLGKVLQLCVGSDSLRHALMVHGASNRLAAAHFVRTERTLRAEFEPASIGI